MLLQDFLRNDGTPELLQEKYAVIFKRHSKYNNLVLFKYNQIESPMGNPLVQECRGVILDESDNWKVISRPFDKFFNHGEGHAKDIDWTTARVQEKVDGSLATIYVYDGKWHIATSGTPDASGDVNGFGMSFEKLFWETFYSSNPFMTLPKLDCNKCFIFELTTPLNKVIVAHKESSVTLLGARDVVTQQELTTQEAAKYLPGCPIVKEYSLSSIDDIIKSFDAISPLSQEGYVVVDNNFHRQKIKHPGYVALHHMRDGLGSKRNLIEVVRSGEIDEVITSFPEYKDILLEIQNRFSSLISELEKNYSEIKDIEVQKEFAWEAVKTKCSSALFSLRAKKVNSIKQFFQEMNIDSLMRLLNYKLTE